MPETELRDIPSRYGNPDLAIVSTLPRGRTQIEFVGHADLTLQLIEVDPNWSWEPFAVDPATGGPMIYQRGEMWVMWAKLHLLGTETIEVGTCEPGKPEIDKELVGDFLRRAAMRRGFATKLWSKTDRQAGLNGHNATEPAAAPAPKVAKAKPAPEPEPASAPESDFQPTPEAIKAVSAVLRVPDAWEALPDGVSDIRTPEWKWYWQLAGKSDEELDGLPWGTIVNLSNETLGGSQMDVLDHLRTFAKEADLPAPGSLAQVKGDLAKELRRHLLFSIEPF